MQLLTKEITTKLPFLYTQEDEADLTRSKITVSASFPVFAIQKGYKNH
ncbi:MAG: hypothetical protein UU73_C0003G0250 [Candidatus Daviesbacteria bacterium GW2011_GWA1_41_61]|uniref:Uncharacterized protein n=1 Tax=Candidatus Daviesbacteria bacterium GW2011_GWA2_40_9 TaxID=1618424 RepID=A0A0G0U957_9BACT|nr:MAG: hypothetical protein UU26_C0004G0032 [Candidatus Daviesbacteria bacterium GW2011_GWC1_40_9]KKR83791.1 MAG: hypothetical protein UU29_C0001G0011 [Candidatus Daviesbacteria bacterium GW2011_GWA2_40_9]KKR93400.1 MAG: hypothetical protein UU44_C0002G0061 [Candidatus Daviesbacteria bacterium GW2011_GWB1_41_15]KKS15051.1 MAG: hypothetical protein UU73_C0003G0250 [Candidatus Daviesbacteria bacterium GW2011_GWA1_41_61]